MKDVFGMVLSHGDKAIMWSDNQGRLLLVTVLDHNPTTKKVKVRREGQIGPYEMRTFWTPAYSNKFYLLLDGE